MKLSGVRYLIKQGVDNVWKNRVMAFASFCVLLVSLLLVGISCLFFLNFHIFGKSLIINDKASFISTLFS